MKAMESEATSSEQEPGAANRFVLTGLRAYSFAALCLALALVLRLMLDRLWGDRIPYITFFFAQLLVMRYAGTGPTVFTIAFGFALGDWFFISPRHSMFIADRIDRYNTVFFFLISFVVLFFSLRTRKALDRERAARRELQEALANVKTLSGLLPICSHCKKVRDDKGYWNQIELFIRDRSNASFSHGICPECARKHYPELFPADGSRKEGA